MIETDEDRILDFAFSSGAGSTTFHEYYECVGHKDGKLTPHELCEISREVLLDIVAIGAITLPAGVNAESIEFVVVNVPVPGRAGEICPAIRLRDKKTKGVTIIFENAGAYVDADDVVGFSEIPTELREGLRELYDETY
jgi:hypothetical protein